jgi:hypothetical protein
MSQTVVFQVVTIQTFMIWAVAIQAIVFLKVAIEKKVFQQSFNYNSNFLPVANQTVVVKTDVFEQFIPTDLVNFKWTHESW